MIVLIEYLHKNHVEHEREREGFKCNPNSNSIIQMNLKSRLVTRPRNAEVLHRNAPGSKD